MMARRSAYHYEVLRGNECSSAGCIKGKEWSVGYGLMGAERMAEVVE